MEEFSAEFVKDTGFNGGIYFSLTIWISGAPGLDWQTKLAV